MDHNLITAGIVGGFATLQQLMLIHRERQKAKRAKEQHEWDMADRAAKIEHVLDEIKRNTEISQTAFEVGNNLNQKLLKMDEKLAVAIPDTANILETMLGSAGTVPASDIARVLVEMKKSADALEGYAHKSVHRLNNMLTRIYALVGDDPVKKRNYPGYDSSET